MVGVNIKDTALCKDLHKRKVTIVFAKPPGFVSRELLWVQSEYMTVGVNTNKSLFPF